MNSAIQLHILSTKLLIRRRHFQIIGNVLKWHQCKKKYKKKQTTANYRLKQTKANYRPISVLPCISKVFEGLMLDQLQRTCDQILSRHVHVSGFRKGFACQNVLLKFAQDCKAALDERKVCGALLTVLTKAFHCDCLPYRLLISKLKAYGMN